MTMNESSVDGRGVELMQRGERWLGDAHYPAFGELV